MKNKDLKRRILGISFKYNLSHLGSCLTAVDIIDDIYSKKAKDEKFILSSGHAGLALYTVIEKYEGIDSEGIWLHHGTHPDRCEKCHIYCSSGSLGQGLSIAVGMALSNRDKNVYCLITDGEAAEGSIWEALRIRRENNLTNLKVYCNYNGWGAYGETDKEFLSFLLGFYGSIGGIEVIETEFEFPFLKGQDAHYHVLSDEEYAEAKKIL